MANRASTGKRNGPALGVDIGGTNTKLGIIDENGHFLARESIPTATISDPRVACQYLLQFARKHTPNSSGQSLAGVGVAVPGILAANEGVLREVANLPQWTDFPLREELRQLFGEAVVVVNDANAAAFAEYERHNLAGKSLALVTLGTGIGCGLVVKGEVFSGDHGCGGEIGHAVIDHGPEARLCGCGKRGHLEAYAGAGGVLETARRLAGSDSATDWTPRQIAQEAESGNRLCQDVVQRTAEFLGHGIALLGQTLNPSVVLLGGAMTFGRNGTQTGRRFLEQVSRTVRQETLEQVGDHLVIAFASLGNDAGVLGAAALARCVER